MLHHLVIAQERLSDAWKKVAPQPAYTVLQPKDVLEYVNSDAGAEWKRPIFPVDSYRVGGFETRTRLPKLHASGLPADIWEPQSPITPLAIKDKSIPVDGFTYAEVGLGRQPVRFHTLYWVDESKTLSDQPFADVLVDITAFRGVNPANSYYTDSVPVQALKLNLVIHALESSARFLRQQLETGNQDLKLSERTQITEKLPRITKGSTDKLPRLEESAAGGQAPQEVSA